METMTGEEIKVGEITIRFLVESEDSNGSVTVFEAGVPAGARVPAAHSHDAYEETIVGVEGVLTWTVDGVAREVGLLGPNYFREVGAVLDAAAGGPPDFAALATVMKKHGLTTAA
jgi:hypothetical protein